MFLIVEGYKLTLDSEDLSRASEQTWRIGYSSQHVFFRRITGSRYHPHSQSLGSFVLKTFQEVEFVNPAQFKNFTKSNLRIVAR
jgi:hypothetical protein